MRRFLFIIMIIVWAGALPAGAAEKCYLYHYQNFFVCDSCDSLVIDDTNPTAFPLDSSNCTQNGAFCMVDGNFASCPTNKTCDPIEVDPAPCTACDGFDTSWHAGATGYEYRHINPTCTDNTCTSNGQCQFDTEYRCAAGSYGSTTDGRTGCVPFDESDIANAICFYTSVEHPDDALVTDGIVGLIRGRCPTPDRECVCEYTRDIPDGRHLVNRYKVAIKNGTRTSFGDRGIVCANGYYGTESTGCTKCPGIGTSYATEPLKNETITDCLIPSKTPFTDDSGTWEYESVDYNSICYYR